jgi:aldose 1-epimerase
MRERAPFRRTGSTLVVAACATIALAGLRQPAQTPAAMTGAVARATYGVMPDGTAIESFTFSNGRGIEIQAISYGGIITSLRVPDRQGRPGDIVLGYDSLEGYLRDNSPYFGAIIGRYANRIAKGRFELGGVAYQLATNNGPNHLHGGDKGFDKVAWQGEPIQTASEVGVAFTRTSPDGEERYPGTARVRVAYMLTGRNELRVTYEATSDKPTPINLTQHSYFNLSGDASRDILSHELTIDADRYTPVDAALIPTGQLAAVEGTPFDFRKPAAIGARIAADHPQLAAGGGYDHNFVLNRSGAGLSPAAVLHDPATGRTATIATTAPGMQFYSGNFLDGRITGKSGRVYRHRFGLCLETQHFPDSPNQPEFPSTILRPGQTYRSETVFTFAVRP